MPHRGMQPGVRQGAAPGQAAAWGTGGDTHGTVVSFNPQKGFGFVNSPALGGDAYFKSDQLQGNPILCQPGTAVLFQLHYSPDGKPQARRIRSASAGMGPGVGAAVGCLAAGRKRPFPNPPAAAWATHALVPQQQAPGLSFNAGPAKRRRAGQLLGQVKSWSINPDGRGFGFISCAEAPGQDVWFGTTSLGASAKFPGPNGEPPVGSSVWFEMFQKPDGRLSAAPESVEPMTRAVPISVTGNLAGLTGTVKSWTLNADGRGFGFLTCPEAQGNDVWFGSTSLAASWQGAQPAVGSTVRFELFQKQDGRLSASNGTVEPA